MLDRKTVREIADAEEPRPLDNPPDDPDTWDSQDWADRIAAHFQRLGREQDDQLVWGLVQLVNYDIVTINSSGELIIRKPRALEVFSLEAILARES